MQPFAPSVGQAPTLGAQEPLLQQAATSAGLAPIFLQLAPPPVPLAQPVPTLQALEHPFALHVGLAPTRGAQGPLLQRAVPSAGLAPTLQLPPPPVPDAQLAPTSPALLHPIAPHVGLAPTSPAMVPPHALYVLQAPTSPALVLQQLQAVPLAAQACTPQRPAPQRWPPARTARLAPTSLVLAWEVAAHSVAAGCTPLRRGHHLLPSAFRVLLERTLPLQGLHCAAHVLLAAGSHPQEQQAATCVQQGRIQLQLGWCHWPRAAQQTLQQVLPTSTRVAQAP